MDIDESDRISPDTSSSAAAMGLRGSAFWLPSAFCTTGGGRLSPAMMRLPSRICRVMSLVFTPGSSKTAVNLRELRSSMRSILGVNLLGIPTLGSWTRRIFPALSASRHLNWAARRTALWNAGLRDQSIPNDELLGIPDFVDIAIVVETKSLDV